MKFGKVGGDGDGWGKASRDVSEQRFLTEPRSRLGELLRVVRIGVEFIKGFRALHFLPPCVTVFGSARLCEDNRWTAWRATSAPASRAPASR
jgi:hypothetical protein